MNGDYLSVKEVENGFVLELNEYSSDKRERRKRLVAKNAMELHALIKTLFPETSVEVFEIPGE